MPAHAQRSENEARNFEIPAQTLRSAITEYGRQAGVQVTAGTSLLEGKRSSAISGRLSPAEALSRLLAGTGLTWRWIDRNTVAMEVAPRVSDGAIQLGSVRVEGANASGVRSGNGLSASNSPARTEGTGSYTSSALTIGKSEQSLRDVPQSVSVITRQRLEDQNLRTLTEALGQATGISVTSFDANRASYSSRGFEIDSLLVDGVPINNGNDDVNATASPDMIMYDRVEVLRGPNGLFQGAGNPAASINLVRKRPLANTSLSAAISAGSWNNYRGEIDITGPISKDGRLRARLAGAYQENDYFYDVVHQKRSAIYGVVESDLTPDTLISIGGAYQWLDGPSGQNIPFYSGGIDIGLPRSTYLGLAWTYYNFRNRYAFAEVKQRLSGEWKITALANYTRGLSNSNGGGISGDVRLGIDPQTALGNWGVSTPMRDYRSLQLGFDVFANGPFMLFGRKQELIFGATTRTQRGGYNMLSGRRIGTMNIFDWNPYIIEEPPLNTAIFMAPVYSSKQSGIYGSLRMNPVARLKLILGSRVSWWKRESRYNPDAVWAFGSSSQRESDVVTPYAGATYDLTETLSLYASYSDVFQPQDGLTWDGGGLKPIVGSNYELGIKGAFFEGALNASLAFYKILQRNRAIPDPEHPCVNGFCFSISGGEVRSQGIEFDISGELVQDLQIAAGYTYNDNEYTHDRDSSGDPTKREGSIFHTGTPRHLIKLWATYQPQARLNRLSVGGGLNYQSSFFSDWGTAILRQGGYALVSLRAGYKLSDSLSLSANVDNLLDKRYWAKFGNVGGSNQYGQPRSFTVTLRGNF
ncbi:Fe(III)-pyochelin receptor [Sphingobium cloacae]|uniref:Fe(III)-pyochelin receptor n=2 Tax=Sphingobium cloacae TaxID=120107 RepID=A0A1E1EYQ0_9SPHN|nr:Fe(III)-pyochelin receptor [Sphingobium cloacae]